MLALVTLGGCSSGSGGSTAVYVFIDPQIEESFGYAPSLEVDVVGISDSDKQRLEKYNIDRYFSGNDRMRTSLKPVTFKFSDDDMVPKAVNSKHRCWDEWGEKILTNIAVLVNLPLVEEDAKGTPEDPRRLVVPMTEGMFNSRPDRYFMVTEGGIVQLSDRPKASKNEKIQGEE